MTGSRQYLTCRYVIILITDLDRPVMSFFDINDQLPVDLHEYMETDLGLEYDTGD